MKQAAVLLSLLAVLCLAFAVKVKVSKNHHVTLDNTAQVGVARVDATMPVGVPLAGYNYDERRVPGWPKPTFTPYTTFMSPSKGVDMPMFVRCMVIQSNNERVALVTADVIGADGSLLQEAYDIATKQGFDIPLDNVILSAAHTHSGPGALTYKLLWSLAPATDIGKPFIRNLYASHIAGCLVEALQAVKPAKIGLGTAELTGASHNRRTRSSPYVNSTYVDTQLGIIRVDDMDGYPLATLWNFAIHGTCYDADKMNQNSDIMGYTNILLEKADQGVAMFVNADAGDVSPSGCEHQGLDIKGSHYIADAVIKARASVQTSTEIEALQVNSKVIDFGKTHLNITLERFDNCTRGGPLDICTICSHAVLNCKVDLHLGNDWLETSPRFTAIRLRVAGKENVFTTIPGEAITELGYQIKSDAAKLGFDRAFLFGYTNNHMGYFTTAREYVAGGYESQLTFWGINTSQMVREGCASVMQNVKPQ